MGGYSGMSKAALVAIEVAALEKRRERNDLELAIAAAPSRQVRRRLERKGLR